MTVNTKYIISILASMLLTTFGIAQYPPDTGTAGADAIHSDSSIIRSWASVCSVTRGYIRIDDKEAGKASSGDDQDCLGKADNISVSLGDSGIAVINLRELDL